MKYNEVNKIQSLWKIAGIGTLAFVFGVAGLPASAQQSQGNLPGYPVASGQQAQNSPNDVPQESNPLPAPAPQMAAPQDTQPPNAAPATATSCIHPLAASFLTRPWSKTQAGFPSPTPTPSR